MNKELAKEWEWSFRNWRLTDGFDPKKLVVQEEIGGGYEWDTTLIFKNENGTFSLIFGCGCSCNSIDEETPEILPSKKQLIIHLEAKIKERENVESLKGALSKVKAL